MPRYRRRRKALAAITPKITIPCQYALSTFFVLCLISQASAQSEQKDSSSPSLSTYKSVAIDLNDPVKKHPNYSPFRHFELLDERSDTLRIGAHTGAGLLGHGNRQFVLPGTVSVVLSNYLNDRFTRSASPYTALIVLRTLWISDGTYTLADLRNDTAVAHVKTKIRLKAEVYAEKEGVYTPLFRFDSTVTCRTGLYFIVGQDLPDLLNGLADSAGISADKNSVGRRNLTL